MGTPISGLLTAARSARRLRAFRRRFPGLSLGGPIELLGQLQNIRLGKGVVLQAGVVLHGGGLEWCRGEGRIEIGDGARISQYCVLYGCGPGGIRIGRDFDCGPGVGIYASRTDYERGPGHHVFEPVSIGDSVTVFANAVISPGVRVGHGAVVAAGSVVTSDVEAGSLVGGVPARVIRERLPNRPLS